MQAMIHDRLKALWDNTGFTVLPDPLRVGYYSEIDLMVWAKKIYDDDFAKWLKKTHNPLDVTIRMAAEKGIVVLNGSGFAGPDWSIRTSEANLNRSDYAIIGREVRSILDEYYNEYKASK